MKLVNDDDVSPGPGKYDVQALSIDDLLRQCEDKKLAKEILANLQDRMPSSMFMSKEPRIAVFPEGPKENQGMDKFYN